MNNNKENRNFKSWSDAEIKYLIDNHSKLKAREIAEHLNRPLGGVRWKCRNLGLPPLKYEKYWDNAEEKYLIDNYKNNSLRELAEKLDRTMPSVKNRLRKLKLYKTENRGKYKKGMTPWNKGTKGVMKGNCKSYKKGHKPHNTKYDGCISIRTDTGTGIKYKWIRISEGNWVEYHRYLWERANGPIPKGMIVRFKDGNSMNCVVENLEMVSMAKNLKMNYNVNKRMAFYLAPKNKKLRKELLNHPELIELKEQKIKLQRSINSEGH